MSKKTRFIAMILCTIFLVLSIWTVAPAPTICMAAQGNNVQTQEAGSLNNDENDDKDDDENSLLNAIPLFILKNLIDTLANYIDVLERILKGELMDVVLEWFGKQMNVWLLQVIGVFGTAFMFTPALSQIGWIHYCWSFCFWVSISLLVLAAVIATGKVLMGTGSGERGDIWEPLKVLGISFLLSVLSIYLMDFSIYLINKMSTAFLTNTLQVVQNAGGVAIGSGVAAGDIPTANLAVKLLFTPDAVFSTQGEPLPLYMVLIQEGGLLLLIICYPLLFSLALVAGARFLLLAGMAIASPIWHVGAALYGRMETLVGFWYQVGKLLILQLVFAVTWLICAQLQLAQIGKLQVAGARSSPNDITGLGLPATVVVTVILIVLLFVSFLWVRSSWRNTLKDPITLGGGKVILGAGRMMGVTANLGSGLSKRFNSPSWTRRSKKLATAADKTRNLGTRWSASSRQTPKRSRVEKWLEKTVSGSKKAYWSEGSHYIVIENGLPVVRPDPPKDGTYMGPWEDRS